MVQERERDVADDAPGGGDDPGTSGDSDAAAAPDGAADEPERPEVVEHDAVYNAFVDAAPRTLPEVIEATGLERDAAERALYALVADGDLDAKTLAADDGAAVDAWFLPASAHVERLASSPLDADRADAVEDAIDDLDVPGVSEMMQSWRRDAIREAWEHLVERGAATDAAIVDAVYPGHKAGYDDRESWWECVRPRLRALPGVAAPSEDQDDVWTYTPAAADATV